MTTARYEMRLRRRKRTAAGASTPRAALRDSSEDYTDDDYVDAQPDLPWLRRRPKLPRKSRRYEFAPVTPQRLSDMRCAISLHVYGRPLLPLPLPLPSSPDLPSSEEEEQVQQRQQQHNHININNRPQTQIQYQQYRQYQQLSPQPHVCKDEHIVRLRAQYVDTCRQTENVINELRRLEQRYANAVNSISAKLTTKRP